MVCTNFGVLGAAYSSIPVEYYGDVRWFTFTFGPLLGAKQTCGKTGPDDCF